MKNTKEDLANAIIELVNRQKELYDCPCGSAYDPERFALKGMFDTAILNYNNILEERIKEIINE